MSYRLDELALLDFAATRPVDRPWFTTTEAAQVASEARGREVVRTTAYRLLCDLVASGRLLRHPDAGRRLGARWRTASRLPGDAGTLLDFAESLPAASPWFGIRAALAALEAEHGYGVDYATALCALARLVADGLLVQRESPSGLSWSVPVFEPGAASLAAEGRRTA